MYAPLEGTQKLSSVVANGYYFKTLYSKLILHSFWPLFWLVALYVDITVNKAQLFFS
jgi:hypothetical protein